MQTFGGLCKNWGSSNTEKRGQFVEHLVQCLHVARLGAVVVACAELVRDFDGDGERNALGVSVGMKTSLFETIAGE